MKSCRAWSTISTPCWPIGTSIRFAYSQTTLIAIGSKNLPYIQAAYAGQKQVFEREIPTPDGRLRHSLATYTPHIVDGVVKGIFVHVADVTPLKLLEHELKTAKAKAELLAAHGLPDRAPQPRAMAGSNEHGGTIWR